MRVAAARREYWLVVELLLTLSGDVPSPSPLCVSLAVDAIGKMDKLPSPEACRLSLISPAASASSPHRNLCIFQLAKSSDLASWKSAARLQLSERFPVADPAAASTTAPLAIAEYSTRPLALCRSLAELDVSWALPTQSRTPSDHFTRIKRLCALQVPVSRVLGALNRLVFTTSVYKSEPKFLLGVYEYTMSSLSRRQVHWLIVELFLSMGQGRVPLPTVDHVSLAVKSALRLRVQPSPSSCTVLPRGRALALPPLLLSLPGLDGPDWKEHLLGLIVRRPVQAKSSPPSNNVLSGPIPLPPPPLPPPPPQQQQLQQLLPGVGALAFSSSSSSSSPLSMSLKSAPRYLQTQTRPDSPATLALLLDDAHSRAHGTLAMETLKRMQELKVPISNRMFAQACEAMVRDKVIKVKAAHLRAIESMYTASFSFFDPAFASHLISGYCLTGDSFEDAHRLFSESLHSSVKLTSEAYSVLIRAYASRPCGDDDEAWRSIEAVLKSMAALGAEHGTRTVNALLFALSKQSRISDSVRYLQGAWWFAQLCTNNSYDKAVYAGGKAFEGKLPRLKAAEPVRLAADAKPNADSFLLASQVFAARHDVALLDAMLSSFKVAGNKSLLGPGPFQSLIKVFAELKRPGDAARVVGDMQRLSVEIDASTVEELVKAMVSSGQVLLAAGHMVALCKPRGLTPTSASVDLLVSAASSKDAARVRESLKEWM